MNDYIDQQLDKVLQLNKEKNQVIRRIKTNRTKRHGMHILSITKEEKEKQIDKARKLYDAKINAIYIKMNQELKKAGLEELENPYQITKGEN
ncbi:hypothetical protein [Alkaliphilus serpentinus]|uniref:Uncharacterized protein n=1 Tax=Alkaliphilus serpentinus TaxID=1482731 RepID=A0A833HM28_9FIRM|nr:hypothetical protein [Alkaliphilus serpentinus]KAB3527117.1 hypothetical protein F8153_13175 [Alkaliphilus serpentinus]